MRRKPHARRRPSKLPVIQRLERADSSCLAPPAWAIVGLEVPVLLTTLLPSAPVPFESPDSRGARALCPPDSSQRRSIVFPNR